MKYGAEITSPRVPRASRVFSRVFSLNYHAARGGRNAQLNRFSSQPQLARALRVPSDQRRFVVGPPVGLLRRLASYITTVSSNLARHLLPDALATRGARVGVAADGALTTSPITTRWLVAALPMRDLRMIRIIDAGGSAHENDAFTQLVSPSSDSLSARRLPGSAHSGVARPPCGRLVARADCSRASARPRREGASSSLRELANDRPPNARPGCVASGGNRATSAHPLVHLSLALEAISQQHEISLARKKYARHYVSVRRHRRLASISRWSAPIAALPERARTPL